VNFFHGAFLYFSFLVAPAASGNFNNRAHRSLKWVMMGFPSGGARALRNFVITKICGTRILHLFYFSSIFQGFSRIGGGEIIINEPMHHTCAGASGSSQN